MWKLLVTTTPPHPPLRTWETNSPCYICRIRYRVIKETIIPILYICRWAMTWKRGPIKKWHFFDQMFPHICWRIIPLYKQVNRHGNSRNIFPPFLISHYKPLDYAKGHPLNCTTFCHCGTSLDDSMKYLSPRQPLDTAELGGLHGVFLITWLIFESIKL